MGIGSSLSALEASSVLPDGNSLDCRMKASIAA